MVAVGLWPLVQNLTQIHCWTHRSSGSPWTHCMCVRAPACVFDSIWRNYQTGWCCGAAADRVTRNIIRTTTKSCICIHTHAHTHTASPWMCSRRCVWTHRNCTSTVNTRSPFCNAATTAWLHPHTPPVVNNTQSPAVKMQPPASLRETSPTKSSFPCVCVCSPCCPCSLPFAAASVRPSHTCSEPHRPALSSGQRNWQSRAPVPPVRGMDGASVTTSET